MNFKTNKKHGNIYMVNQDNLFLMTSFKVYPSLFFLQTLLKAQNGNIELRAQHFQDRC